MTQAELKKILETALQAIMVEVTDESALHRGHHGFSGKAGTHFRCVIVSPLFDERSLLERHQLVYACLPNIMGCEIHALALQTLSTSEWHKKISTNPTSV
jgi:BolA protein